MSQNARKAVDRLKDQHPPIPYQAAASRLSVCKLRGVAPLKGTQEVSIMTLIGTD